MSSNFWSSSHSKYWLLSRTAQEAARATDLRYATRRQVYCLGLWFANLIQKLGKRLLLRQIPIATATVFFRRFYLKNSYCETNPYLVLAACCFVAAKVEETPVHIKSVVAEAKIVFTEHGIKSFPSEPNKLGEMEFYLLEDLDFHLVVFHPYRALVAICGREPSDAGTFPQSRSEEDSAIHKRDLDARRKRDDEIRKAPGLRAAEEDAGVSESEEERIRRLMGRGSGEGLMEIDESVLQFAWWVPFDRSPLCGDMTAEADPRFTVNDTYRTDVPLLYPPYIIALACLYIGFIISAQAAHATRTRSSSSQVAAPAGTAALHLPSSPKTPAEFLASFQVSLPTLMACVQDIIVLYPIWESFEASPRYPGAPVDVGSPAPLGGGKDEKFGPEDAERLVRKMIEDRMFDTSHPDHMGGAVREDSAIKGTGRKRSRA
ncbi:cyclin-C, partial [Tremellales sp. Uapishka_1]